MRNRIAVCSVAAAITFIVAASPAPSAAAANTMSMLPAEPYIGEIAIFAGNFAPRGWAFCDGSLLLINSNSALFSLLGTTYGGDGRTTFGLPDLRGRVALHAGLGAGLPDYRLGQRGGVEEVTLTAANGPRHDHEMFVQPDPGDSDMPAGKVPATTVSGNVMNNDRPYGDLPAAPSQSMDAGVVSSVGGGQAHPNMQPFLGLNYVIALTGVFPSRNDEPGAIPYIGQVSMFAGNFAPRGWALCDGQLLQISSHTALFSILGTTYGGDGRTTFGLPDLRGRVPIQPGTGPGLPTYRLGERGGQHEVTLGSLNAPPHKHDIFVQTDLGDASSPVGKVYARASSMPPNEDMPFGDLPATPSETMDENVLSETGGQAHENMEPYLAINYIIALQGTFPSRNALGDVEPVLAGMSMFAGNFAPRGWAFCEGQLLPISDNQALFSLLGTIYGGDGRTTFALPDLRGRVPLHAGNGPGLTPRSLGERGGTHEVALSVAQEPGHRHLLQVQPGVGTTGSPVDGAPATATNVSILNNDRPYGDLPGAPTAMFDTDAITLTGAGQAHENMQPYLGLNYIIALQGVFPSRN